MEKEPRSTPFLIIACGLTGTGKSTILNEVAKEKDILILTSDMIRKELAGISPAEHRYVEFDSGIYSEEFTKKTYIHMIEEGKKHILQGRSVILDACFPKKWQREKAKEGAKEVNAHFLCVQFTCPEEEVRERLEKRFESKEGVSDGRWEIYLSQKESFEDVDEFDSDSHMIVDTSLSKVDIIKKIMDRLKA
ncbi:MAG: AAA family ATPase [Methanomassiliicoccales archaeon]|nr:MAG: AAA family ATPase [Methanomassiliicoccales archaeon]